MNNKIKQVLIGSMLGDGNFTKNRFETGCKFKEYIDFKIKILKSYAGDKWYTYIPNNPFSASDTGNPYHRLALLVNEEIR